MKKTNTALTRMHIVEALTQKENLNPKKGREFLEATLELIIAALEEKEGVKLASFGSFKVRQKPKRVGRNPKTGKEAVITPRGALSFKASPYLRAKVEYSSKRQ